jgi:hypothetical protein
MDPRTDFLKLERIESIHEVRTRVATEDLKYCMVSTATGRTNPS